MKMLIICIIYWVIVLVSNALVGDADASMEESKLLTETACPLRIISNFHPNGQLLCSFP